MTIQKWLVGGILAASLVTAACPAYAEPSGTDVLIRYKTKDTGTTEQEVSFIFPVAKKVWLRVGGEVDVTPGKPEQKFVVLGAVWKSRTQDIGIVYVPHKEVTLEVRLHL